MPTLVAHFDIPMPNNCLVECRENVLCIPSFQIDNFDIEIEIIISLDGPQLKLAGESIWTREIDRILIAVSRKEKRLPPKIIAGPDGTKNYGIQSEYFKQIIDDYKAAARKAANRIIKYFKYKLNTPLLSELDKFDQSLQNPIWTDSQKNLVGKYGIIFTARMIPEFCGKFGIKKLTTNNYIDLFNFVLQDFNQNIVDEILSDAHGALFDEKLRRAILELAIACEVIVKRFFFCAETPAGAAFDYLEDKAKISVRIIDLIDKISLEAFGHSFREDKKADFINIDRLFRCRNKVAHRGQIYYKDDSGKKIDVVKDDVEKWGGSVVELMNWLRKFKKISLPSS